MPVYTITEPHPTVRKDTYTHTGRGGAGNVYRVPATTTPAAAPVPRAQMPRPAERFYSGRGGAGNAHPADVRPAPSFDDEYAYAAARETTSSGHVGRGGAGNVFGSKSASASTTSRKESLESAPRSSADDAASTRSTRATFWARVSGASVGSHH